MLIILYCVLFNHNSSVCKGYRLRVTIYNDQIKRLVSKSIVPYTNRKLCIFKAAMSTKGTDKPRAPLFRWKLILENFPNLINYVPNFRRLNWVKYHEGFLQCVGKRFWLHKNCATQDLLFSWASNCQADPVPQNGQGFMYRTCMNFLILNFGNKNAAGFSHRDTIKIV